MPKATFFESAIYCSKLFISVNFLFHMIIHANEFKTTEKQKYTATYIGKSRQKAGFISPRSSMKITAKTEKRGNLNPAK